MAKEFLSDVDLRGDLLFSGLGGSGSDKIAGRLNSTGKPVWFSIGPNMAIVNGALTLTNTPGIDPVVAGMIF